RVLPAVTAVPVTVKVKVWPQLRAFDIEGETKTNDDVPGTIVYFVWVMAFWQLESRPTVTWALCGKPGVAARGLTSSCSDVGFAWRNESGGASAKLIATAVRPTASVKATTTAASRTKRMGGETPFA